MVHIPLFITVSALVGDIRYSYYFVLFKSFFRKMLKISSNAYRIERDSMLCSIVIKRFVIHRKQFNCRSIIIMSQYVIHDFVQ